MCGSRDMVFPYMNMLSFWVYLLAVLVLLASFFVPGGPTGAGWTLYPPQAILEGTPGSGAGIILMTARAEAAGGAAPQGDRFRAAVTLPLPPLSRDWPRPLRAGPVVYLGRGSDVE